MESLNLLDDAGERDGSVRDGDVRVGGASMRRRLTRDARGIWIDRPSSRSRLVDRVNACPIVAWGYDPIWRPRSVGWLTRGRYDGRRERDDMATWTAPPDGKVLLDVGCGSGYALRALHDAQPGARLHGIDRSAAFLGTAAKRLRADDIEATLVHGLASDLPYADHSVASVIFAGTPNEVPDRGAVLAEIARVLQPGGALWLMISIRGSNTLSRLGARAVAWTGLELPEPDTVIDEVLAAGFEAARLEHRSPLLIGRFRRRA